MRSASAREGNEDSAACNCGEDYTLSRNEADQVKDREAVAKSIACRHQGANPGGLPEEKGRIVGPASSPAPKLQQGFGNLDPSCRSLIGSCLLPRGCATPAHGTRLWLLVRANTAFTRPSYSQLNPSPAFMLPLISYLGLRHPLMEQLFQLLQTQHQRCGHRDLTGLAPRQNTKRYSFSPGLAVLTFFFERIRKVPIKPPTSMRPCASHEKKIKDATKDTSYISIQSEESFQIFLDTRLAIKRKSYGMGVHQKHDPSHKQRVEDGLRSHELKTCTCHWRFSKLFLCKSTYATVQYVELPLTGRVPRSIVKVRSATYRFLIFPRNSGMSLIISFGHSMQAK
ncbi:uncharacterized protein BDR25DRAFT_348571 [Lindgomyces ingoldianus]|uniref:Uncharacterized protein n=1 Tax=Lindgomyces ingoldianus TaxID=673940 RepID=A0ACB6RJ03_9PLEO|nr:uncharacterized protein BDR25DRAFT_348571 [Lindgomyces ingoldianus]KAF2478312.1 hypothetical protein BDR25DRAFT_348571 [Lindgomyces ingoldianus]